LKKSGFKAKLIHLFNRINTMANQITVTPSNPLNLIQRQQTFTEEVHIQGGSIIAQGQAVDINFTKLVKDS